MSYEEPEGPDRVSPSLDDAGRLRHGAFAGRPLSEQTTGYMLSMVEENLAVATAETAALRERVQLLVADARRRDAYWPRVRETMRSDLPTHGKLLFLTIAMNGGSVRATTEDMARIMTCSTSTVKRYRNALLERGLIEFTNEGKGGKHGWTLLASPPSPQRELVPQEGE